jgi:histidinol-phosphate aminotransferase
MTALVSRVEGLRAYQRAPLPEGVSLRLDANEGPPAAMAIAMAALEEGGGELLRRYPDTRPLEARLAGHFQVDAARVFVSAGADDVIDRCCRAYLTPGSSLLIAEPGFEMFDHYAALAGARVSKAVWSPGEYPLDRMLEKIDDLTRVIAFVTPNNPTGQVATADDLRRLAAAAPQALVILDHAYVDFADADLTTMALEMPNVAVVRTFSKAWGLAGCRVGYALGPAPVIRSLRAAGGPFPVSAPSLAIAAALFERGGAAREAYVRRIRVERSAIYDQLASLGAAPRRSQGNFVFVELGQRSTDAHARLVKQGILVRMVAASGVPIGLRISLPGDATGFARLTTALSGSDTFMGSDTLTGSDT